MTEPNMSRDNPGMNEEDTEQEMPTVTLDDEEGRSLLCYVDHYLEIEDEEYMLLIPVDPPIQIFAIDEDEDGSEIIADIDDEEIDTIFPIARSVLAEYDLALRRTAFTLTASGELPEANEEDTFILDIGGDEDEELRPEEFQQLVRCYAEEQEYLVCTPCDPLLIVARLKEDGQPEPISPEEFKLVYPYIEDLFFDDESD